MLYAALSLTLVRMVPVALACIGAGLDRDTVLFVGWFGPRGLASLVFALLALEQLGGAVAVGVTVLLSVLAHGLTAAPQASRYERALTRRGIDGVRVRHVTTAVRACGTGTTRARHAARTGRGARDAGSRLTLAE